MTVFLKVFAEAQEPEFIEDERDAFGSQWGTVVGHLKVQVCCGRVARVSDLCNLGSSLDFLMPAYLNAPLLQMSEHHVCIRSDAHDDVVAGDVLYRNHGQLSRDVIRNIID